MSERERMYQLLDTVPDNKIAYIIGYIQGLITSEKDAPKTVTIPEAEYNELAKAMRNAEYMAKLDRADAQIRDGRVVTKTMDELLAMEE